MATPELNTPLALSLPTPPQPQASPEESSKFYRSLLDALTSWNKLVRSDFLETVRPDANGDYSLSGNLEIDTGGTAKVIIANDPDYPAYNLITFNGNISDAGYMGMGGGGNTDETLYFQAPGDMNFRTGGDVVNFKIKASGAITASNLSTHANNADAAANGLVAGDFYRTAAGVVMVVY